MAEKNSLWKNIRANRGSGKKPTAEMLRQERKIRAKQYAEGSFVGEDENDIPYRPLSMPMEGYEWENRPKTKSTYDKPKLKKGVESNLVPVNKQGLPYKNLREYEISSSALPKDYLEPRYVAERSTTSTKNTPAMSTSGKEANSLYTQNYGKDMAQNIKVGLDIGQFTPAAPIAYGLSLPFTAYDVASDLYNGQYNRAAVDALGFIPGTNTIRRVRNTLNSADLLNDVAGDEIDYENLTNNPKQKATGGYYPTQGPGKGLFKGYAEGGYTINNNKSMKNNNQSWKNYLQYAKGGPFKNTGYAEDILPETQKQAEDRMFKEMEGKVSPWDGDKNVGFDHDMHGADEWILRLQAAGAWNGQDTMMRLKAAIPPPDYLTPKRKDNMLEQYYPPYKVEPEPGDPRDPRYVIDYENLNIPQPSYEELVKSKTVRKPPEAEYAQGGYTNPYNQYQKDPYLNYAGGGYMYAGGGRGWKKFGNTMADIGLGIGDVALGSIGSVTGIKSLQDTIGTDQYHNDDFDTGANFVGKLAGTALKYIPVTAPFAAAAGVVGGVANAAIGIDRKNYDPSKHQTGLDKAGDIVNIAGDVGTMFVDPTKAANTGAAASKGLKAGETATKGIEAAKITDAAIKTGEAVNTGATALDTGATVVDATKSIVDAGNTIGTVAATAAPTIEVASNIGEVAAATTAAKPVVDSANKLSSGLKYGEGYYDAVRAANKISKYGNIAQTALSVGQPMMQQKQQQQQQQKQLAESTMGNEPMYPKPDSNTEYAAITTPTFNTGTPQIGDNINTSNQFFSQGGNITNNSLNLRNTMRYKRFAQGGTLEQQGINFITEKAGLHYQNANGGVPIGPGALAEGGEAKLQMADGGQYIVSDQVDGANTQTIDGQTMAERLKKRLKPFMMGGLASNPRDKEELRRPHDSVSAISIAQAKQETMQENESVRMKTGGALQYAANGGRITPEIKKLVEAERKRLAQEEYSTAYNGIDIKKHGGLNYSRGGKVSNKNVQEFAKQILASKGGYVHNQMTQPMYAAGGNIWVPPNEELAGMGYTPDQIEAIKLADKKSPVFESEEKYKRAQYNAARATQIGDAAGISAYSGVIPKRLNAALELGSTLQTLQPNKNIPILSGDEQRIKLEDYNKNRDFDENIEQYNRRRAREKELDELENPTKAEGGPLYGNPSSPYTYAYGGMYGNPYARGGQIDYTNDMYSMYAGGGPMVSNVKQPFNGPTAQNRGGMYMTYADGGMMPPEQQMMQQQMQQQQAPQEQMQQQGGGEEQMMQMVEQVMQALMQGANPEQIMQQLVQSGVPQEQAQQVVQMAMQEAQGQMQQQQGQQQPMQGQEQMMPPQGMMARGGRMYYEGGPDGPPYDLPGMADMNSSEYNSINSYLTNLNTPNVIDNQGNTSSILGRMSNQSTQGPNNPEPITTLDRLKQNYFDTSNSYNPNPSLPNNELGTYNDVNEVGLKSLNKEDLPADFNLENLPSRKVGKLGVDPYPFSLSYGKIVEDKGGLDNLVPGLVPMDTSLSERNLNTMDKDTPWSEEPWYSKAARRGSVIPGIAATVTGMLNKKRRLDPSLMTAQKVDYTTERINDAKQSRLKYNKYADVVRNMGNQGYGNLKDALLNSNAALAGRISESVMREGNTNAQLAQQADMTNTASKNQFKQINEGMFQNAQTQALAGLGDTFGDKLPSIAAEERKQYLQEWIARNRLNTRNYSTADSGNDVFYGSEGEVYDARTHKRIS